MECLNERDEVVTMVMKKIVQNLERQKARKGQQRWEGDGSSSFGDSNTLDQSLPDVNDSLLGVEISRILARQYSQSRAKSTRLFYRVHDGALTT